MYEDDVPFNIRLMESRYVSYDQAKCMGPMGAWMTLNDHLICYLKGKLKEKNTLHDLKYIYNLYWKYTVIKYIFEGKWKAMSSTESWATLLQFQVLEIQ